MRNSKLKSGVSLDSKMKIILIIALLGGFLFGNITHTYAHSLGQDPFFKINGKYSDFYPVQSGFDFPDFTLPQDLAPENYLINQSIEFELDTEQLGKYVGEEVLDKSKFIWNYGDGNTAEGLKNTHSYQKIGSYILTIQVDTSSFEAGIPLQLLQSVMLHIMPDQNYLLPKALIKINGKQEFRDPKTNILQNVFGVNMDHQVKFDGSGSTAASSKIVSYLWDFGDGTMSEGAAVNHKYNYNQNYNFFTPALRTKDENGFISDTSVGIKQNPSLSAGKVKLDGEQIVEQPPNTKKYLILGAVIIIVLFVGVVIYMRKRISSV